MKLYMHPVSTTSRPVRLFIADEGIACEQEVVDLMTGAHLQPAYLAINPNGLVPYLVDGDFGLSESAAILRYLAEKTGSAAYPKDLRERARVNEVMDWLNSNMYRDWGYNLIYPQIFPHHRRRSDEAQEASVAMGQEKSRRWLSLLNDHYIGNRQWVAGDRMTIADYFAAGIMSVGDTIGCTLGDYPNVDRWLGTMRARPNWAPLHGHFDGMVAAFKGPSYRTI